MVARSGTAVSAQKGTFGHGRSVAGARQASCQCCKVKTCKQCRAQWAEERELRELREENQILKNEGEKPSVQFEEASEEVMCEEDEKMEKGGDLDSKKK